MLLKLVIDPLHTKAINKNKIKNFTPTARMHFMRTFYGVIKLGFERIAMNYFLLL
jgi:hypothetical protein